MDSHTLQKYLKQHSEKSKTRHKQKPHERIDIHSIAMVKAKQYIVEMKRKSNTQKMLQNIVYFTQKIIKKFSK